MPIQTLTRVLHKVFGSRNDRMLKRYRQRVVEINALETQVQKLTDAELRAKTREFRERSASGAPVKEFLPEVLAIAREGMDRYIGMRKIFDPAAGFDANLLPESLRPLYAQVRAEADALPPLDVPGGDPAPGWLQVEVPVELYAAVRALVPESRPPFRCRSFDVQLIGGMVLGEGRIAEMRTGEGKTIVAPLACFVAICEGLQCTVVTVNDYLVQRDRDWTFPFYFGLGLTVGAIHPMHMQPAELKKESYGCNVLYATSSELGFDYLRDNMKSSVEDQVQKQRDFVIIDEVDSILIDEARTPLIISGPAHQDAPRYDLADQVARHLMDKQQDWLALDDQAQAVQKQVKGLEGDIRNTRNKAAIPGMRAEMQRLETEHKKLLGQRDKHTQFFEVEREKKASHLTHAGVAEAQKRAGIGSFYVGSNMDFPHLLENALRAHAIYRLDREYVVKDGEIVIVDEFTGRLMVGRQWSDGLHQAIEAKERVRIKEETQTLATVTVQNFFKLFKRRGGMTGTAITEATEFWEIYALDVVSIPTNRKVSRVDRDDLIFLSQKDKWSAILDEIKRVHDIGAPVLVGTTSVEKSEKLAAMLGQAHGIAHEVLNAKQHERESHIVENAGELGSVMIATNMAGRGTDIKMRSVSRDALLAHWIARDLLPEGADLAQPDQALIEASYRHQAARTLGLSADKAGALDTAELKLRLLRAWVAKDTLLAQDRAAAERAARMSLEDCMAALDAVPGYIRHRLAIWKTTEEMGGLHIVGTERHESRRIDNQLRGRAGRQGDKGSSRFFLSLDDDLMKMFAGGNTLRILSTLGMKEGDAIEHPMVSNAVARAQKKVEERNYEQRKSLLDYDEVMEYQRRDFYGTRQTVLVSDEASTLVLDYIGDAVDAAAETFLAPEYVSTQVAEWCRTSLDISVDASKLRLDDPAGLQTQVRRLTADDAEAVVRLTVGEYVFAELPEQEWDLRALCDWFRTRFGVDVVAGDLRGKSPAEISAILVSAARARVESLDMSGAGKFLDPLVPVRDFCKWAKDRFDVDIAAEELAQLKDPSQMATRVLRDATRAYRKRELQYGVEAMLDIFHQGFSQDPAWAMDQLQSWHNRRFGENLDQAAFEKMLEGRDIAVFMVEKTAGALKPGGAIEQEACERTAALAGDLDGLAAWLRHRHEVAVTRKDLEGAADLPAYVVRKARQAFRSEFTRLERFVLLQVLDQAWKDHLYAMDQLKDGINLHSFAEKDPRIEYKKSGSRLFKKMQKAIRNKVSETIFRARLSANVRLNPPQQPEPAFDEAQFTALESASGGIVGLPVTPRMRRASSAGPLPAGA